jgi:uncharacterized protein (TIGR02284 family)
MTDRHTISTLNYLIDTCKDGGDGFRLCAELAANAHLKTLFLDRSRRFAQARFELLALLAEFGGLPTQSLLAHTTMDRGWRNLKTVILGHDDELLLAECERGEDSAIRAYRNALDGELPLKVRNAIVIQYGSALQNFDLIRYLRGIFATRTDRQAPRSHLMQARNAVRTAARF